MATKGGYRHFLRKEIAEQPQAWIDTMSGRAAANSASVNFEMDLMPAGGAKSIERIVMLGAGASWITANIGKFIIEEVAGVPVEVDYAGEFRYRRPPVGKGTVVMAVSQSGETADTLAAMEEGGVARGASDCADEYGGFIDRAEGECADIHAMRAGNQRNDDKMLHYTDRGVLSIRDTSSVEAGTAIGGAGARSC